MNVLIEHMRGWLYKLTKRQLTRPSDLAWKPGVWCAYWSKRHANGIQAIYTGSVARRRSNSRQRRRRRR